MTEPDPDDALVRLAQLVRVESSILASEDDEALVQLARIVRVQAHKRRNKFGRSEQVDAYVRKIHDFLEGPNAKTRRRLASGRMLANPEGEGTGSNAPLKGGFAVQPRRGPAVRKTGRFLANPEGLPEQPLRPSDEQVNARIASVSAGKTQYRREYNDRLAARLEASAKVRADQEKIKKTPEFKARAKGVPAVSSDDSENDQRDLLLALWAKEVKAGRLKTQGQYEAEALKKRGLTVKEFHPIRGR